MSFIVKNTTLPGLLDLLAPHSCRGCGRTGTALCDRCKKYLISASNAFSPDLQDRFLDSSVPIYIAAPRDGLMGALIHDLKYNSVRALARPLAEVLAAALPEFDSAVVIIPLPTIGRHIRERGLDHTLLIAKELARLKNWRVEPLLTRARSTVQVGTNRDTRKKQATTAYELTPHTAIDSSATYLLLDDVWTTGATMSAAIKIMAELHPRRLAAALLAQS